MTITALISLLGGWSVLVVAVSAWLSHLAAQRILSKWKRDEDHAIETLRDELSSSRLSLEAAVKSHAVGQDLFQQRRVAAVQRLWAAVLELRERLSGPVFFFGILLPSEYDSEFERGGAMAASVSALTDKQIVDIISSTKTLEGDRPQLGDTLWLRFFIYRAFLARLAHLIIEGHRKAHIRDWREDGGVRQLLGHLLPDTFLTTLLNSPNDVTAVNKVVNTLESLILEEISLITSGRRSSFESFENVRQLREQLASERANGV